MIRGTPDDKKEVFSMIRGASDDKSGPMMLCQLKSTF